IVRGPVRGECRDGSARLSASPDFLSVSAVFRREHQLHLHAVVEAVRPAVIPALNDAQQLLGGKVGALLGREALRPVLAQLVAPVLSRIDAVPAQSIAIPSALRMPVA